jgi:hypothetical protein
MKKWWYCKTHRAIDRFSPGELYPNNGLKCHTLIMCEAGLFEHDEVIADCEWIWVGVKSFRP